MTPAAFADLVLARLAGVRSTLTSKSWPDLSPWWAALLERFVRSGCLQLVARVGRRGGKSSTACIFAVAFALTYAGLGLVPPGDVGWVVFVSVRRDEAMSRLRTIEAVLRVLGVKFVPAEGDAIIIAGTNIGFRVQACNVAAVSGWTSILIVADEVAKYRDADTGANPATEVLAALRPTMATQPLARIFLISSPLGPDDAHARAFDAGDSEFQLTAFAESWVANPTLTEEDTRRLEPDPKLHAREYGAKPSQAVSSAFEADQVLAAIGPVSIAPVPPPLLLLDASAGKGDSFVWALAQRFMADGRERIRVGGMSGFEGRFHASWTSDRAIEWLATSARKTAYVQSAVGDGYSDYFLIPALQKHGINYTTLPWSNESKVAAVGRVRQWLRDGVLVVEPGPEAEKWKAEMIAFREKLTASGFTTFGARHGGHDDRVALILNLAMADIAGMLPSARGVAAPPPPILTHFDDTPSDLNYSSVGYSPSHAADNLVSATLRRDATTQGL